MAGETSERDELADVLAKHQIRSWGISGNSGDGCVCGERIFPLPALDEFEDIAERRDRARAAHQSAAVSGWLAGHDREVRAALRKELAAEIEAERDPDGDWEYETALLKAIVIVEGEPK